MEHLPTWVVTIAAVAVGLSPGLAILFGGLDSSTTLPRAGATLGVAPKAGRGLVPEGPARVPG
jgi:hypothetical protein